MVSLKGCVLIHVVRVVRERISNGAVNGTFADHIRGRAASEHVRSQRSPMAAQRRDARHTRWGRMACDPCRPGGIYSISCQCAQKRVRPGRVSFTAFVLVQSVPRQGLCCNYSTSFHDVPHFSHALRVGDASERDTLMSSIVPELFLNYIWAAYSCPDCEGQE